MAAPDPGAGNDYPRQGTGWKSAPYQSDQTYDPSRWLSAGLGAFGKGAGAIGGALAGAARPATVDLSGVRAAQDRAFGTQDQLAAERAGFGGNYNPGNDTSLAAQQQMNINGLAAAASGRVPSPAELQLQQQAARNAANSYGTAAALQGRSPGAALRMGTLGAVNTQAATNAQAAIQRAQDTQAAQQQLIQALSSARGQGQNLLAQDMDWRKALLSGQLGALGAGTTAAGNEANAQSQAAAAQNAYKGSLIGGGASILGALL